MQLSEMLDTVDTMMTNSFSNKFKIGIINRLRTELYRDYPLPDTAYPFITDGNTQKFKLPEDCVEDRIMRVVIGGVPLGYLPFANDQVGTDREFWTVISGEFVFNPVGWSGENGFIYYRPKPISMTEDDLEKEVDFPADFHDVLLYGLAKAIALALPEPNMTKASAFDAEYTRLAEKADAVLRKPRQNKVILTRPWR